LRRNPGNWRGGLGGLVHRSLHRRPDRSASAALLLALATSFGVAGTVFAASFDASRRQDARYVVGGDLRVTLPVNESQPASFADTLRVPGVEAVTPVMVANETLVGTQMQTIFGVDLPSLTAATTIADSYFVDDSAQAVLDRLRSTPTGVLVNTEMAVAYNIVSGDTIAVRIPKVHGGYTDARLPVVGIFYVFPTGPHNSDLIVNSAFLVAATENPNAGFFLLKTDGTEQTNAQVATLLTQRLRGTAARIQTADQAVSQDQSSLVGVNLSGLVALDRLYAALVIALGFGVFLLGAIIERARELGTLEALGATLRQVVGMLLMEGGTLVIAGLLGGLLIGVPLAWQYNAFLPGIFSVALPVVSVPLGGIAVLLLLALAGVGIAALISTLRLRKLWPAEVLRDL
jgi:ABC-type antimicrobial peptide transport system permease subunit